MKNKLLFLPLFAILLMSTLPLTAYASPSATLSRSSTFHSSASSSLYTVNWYDNKGNIAKSWHGSRVNAEKIAQSEHLKHTKHPQIQSQSVVPNFNIVYPCYIPNDFFDFFSGQLECFANRGSAAIGVYGVTEVASGRNHGSFVVLVCQYSTSRCSNPITITINYNTYDYPLSNDYWNATYLTILPS